MRRPHTISRKLRILAWCCVVVSLLFSVGEGLQLAPFASHNGESKSSQFIASSNLDVAFFAHGPIDVPVQFRKREKRDSNDLELPPSPVGEELLLPRTLASNFHEPEYFQVLTFAAPGRAPPQVSKS